MGLVDEGQRTELWSARSRRRTRRERRGRLGESGHPEPREKESTCGSCCCLPSRVAFAGSGAEATGPLRVRSRDRRWQQRRMSRSLRGPQRAGRRAGVAVRDGGELTLRRSGRVGQPDRRVGTARTFQLARSPGVARGHRVRWRRRFSDRRCEPDVRTALRGGLHRPRGRRVRGYEHRVLPDGRLHFVLSPDGVPGDDWVWRSGAAEPWNRGWTAVGLPVWLDPWPVLGDVPLLDLVHATHPLGLSTLRPPDPPPSLGPGNTPSRPSGDAGVRTGPSGHRLPRPGSGPHAPGPPRSPPGDDWSPHLPSHGN